MRLKISFAWEFRPRWQQNIYTVTDNKLKHKSREQIMKSWSEMASHKAKSSFSTSTDREWSLVYDRHSVPCVCERWCRRTYRAFMVGASRTAVSSEMPEGVHMKYSGNKQQVSKCTERTSLSYMALLYIQQLYFLQLWKITYLQEWLWSEFSLDTFNLLLYK